MSEQKARKYITKLLSWWELRAYGGDTLPEDLAFVLSVPGDIQGKCSNTFTGCGACFFVVKLWNLIHLLLFPGEKWWKDRFWFRARTWNCLSILRILAFRENRYHWFLNWRRNVHFDAIFCILSLRFNTKYLYWNF